MTAGARGTWSGLLCFAVVACAGACVAPAAATRPSPPVGAAASPAQSGAGDDPGPRPADADADVAYYGERAALLATQAPTEIARTDFVRLRRGRMYRGQEVSTRELEMALTKGFSAGDDQAVLDLTAKLIADDQADIRAHMLRAVVLRRTQRPAEASFHREVAIGLIESIVRGGDGKSFETAWTVFRVKEEYEVLKAGGYMVQSQSLQTHGPRVYDVLEARQPSGEKKAFSAYFEITEMFAEEGRAFAGKK